MANMLYNGVELPDIEAVWTDKVTYPYSYISRLGPQYTLALLTTTFYVNASGTIMYWSADGSGATYTADINTDTGEVGDWVFERTFTYSKGGWSTGPAIEPVTWHSFDVYDSSGQLYSATTAPVDPNAPVSTFDKTAFLSGLAMGLTGKGDPVFDDPSYYFTEGSKTLTINKDDGSLSYAWDWDAMQFDVEANS